MKRKTAEPQVSYEVSCVGFNLRKAARIVSRVYEKEMKGAPVKGPLFSLLASISKRGPISISALAEGIGLERTTLTRNLRHLEERQFIRVQQETANRKIISILPAGSKELAE